MAIVIYRHQDVSPIGNARRECFTVLPCFLPNLKGAAESMKSCCQTVSNSAVTRTSRLGPGGPRAGQIRIITPSFSQLSTAFFLGTHICAKNDGGGGRLEWAEPTPARGSWYGKRRNDGTQLGRI